jgi:DoxX-like family
MNSTVGSGSISKASLGTGRVISGVVVLFLLFDGITKLLKVPQVVDATIRIGFPVTIAGIGITLLVCTAIYAIPKTSTLGVILLTGYLGGATAAQLRAGSPVFETLFPVIFGVLAWLGLYLREQRLRALLPLRNTAEELRR